MQRLSSVPSAAPVLSLLPRPLPELAVDAVFVLGPNKTSPTANLLQSRCANLRLSTYCVGDGVNELSASAFETLHRLGVLGARTQVFVFAHGAARSDYHSVEVSRRPRTTWRTGYLIRLIRTGSIEETPGSWGGMIHIISCAAGKFRQEASTHPWLGNSGPCLLYAGRKSSAVFEETLDTVTQFFHFMSDHRHEDLSPLRVLAFTANTTSGCLSLVGAGSPQELVVHAPKDPACLSQNWLGDQLSEPASGVRTRKVRAVGSSEDLQQLHSEIAHLTPTTRAREHSRLVKTFMYRIAVSSPTKVKPFLDASDELIHAAHPCINLTPLAYAIHHKRADVAEFLIERGACLEGDAGGDATPLVSACRQGSVPMTRMLIARGVDLNHPQTSSETPLMAVCKTENEELVRLLLDAGAAIDACDAEGKSALFYAVQTGNEEIIKLLLDNKANPDIGASLLYAASDDNPDVVETLIAAGAAVNINVNGDTPLLSALFCGSHHAASLLLEAAASLDGLAGRGETPLMLACMHSPKTVGLILSKSPKLVHVADFSGVTPLMAVCKTGNEELVRLLLDAGATIDACDAEGKSALFYAVQTGDEEIIDILLDNRANPDIGASLLYAASDDNPDVVETLIAAGAAVNINVNGETPLLSALFCGSHHAASLLLEADASLDVLAGRGETPLMLACMHTPKTVGLILSKSPKLVHVADFSGVTPLMAASTANAPEAIKLLIASGADLNARNKLGKTALIVACETGAVAAAKALVEAGADVSIVDVAGISARQAANACEDEDLKGLLAGQQSFV